MSRIIILCTTVFLLAACTPSDIQYCRERGLPPGQQAFLECQQHYAHEQQRFDLDATLCGDKAHMVYPDYLYDRSRQGYATVIDRRGRVRDIIIETQPDYARNSALSSLRYRVIAPCMWEKGWNSPQSWTKGRHAPGTPLPR